MRLKNIKEKLRHKRQDKIVKRITPVSWWKLAVGIVLFCFGVFFGYMYLNNERLIFFGVGAVFTFAPGLLLIYQSFKTGESGFFFKKKYTGKENAVVLMARRNGQGTKDVPVGIRFLEIKPHQLPKGARLRYIRNLKKHFYELLYNPITKKLEPVVLPDKKSFPPELYKIPATMQPYKDYMEYSPPTMLQKVAPGILLLAIFIVGILMVMTGN